VEADVQAVAWLREVLEWTAHLLEARCDAGAIRRRRLPTLRKPVTWQFLTVAVIGAKSAMGEWAVISRQALP
jgi:hypothetical protein